MEPSQHSPGDNIGWLAAAATGAFGLLRALIARKPKPPQPPDLSDLDQSEAENALIRGGQRAAILARLSEVEDCQQRILDRYEIQRSGMDRLEQLVHDQREDFFRALKDMERRIMQRIDDIR